MPTDPVMVLDRNEKPVFDELQVFAHLPRIGETIVRFPPWSDDMEEWEVLAVVHQSRPAEPATPEAKLRRTQTRLIVQLARTVEI